MRERKAAHGATGRRRRNTTLCILQGKPVLIAAAAFAIVVLRSRFVSLGSIVATVALPIVEWLTPGLLAIDIAATVVAALILFRHRGNMARLRSRTERALGT